MMKLIINEANEILCRCPFIQDMGMKAIIYLSNEVPYLELTNEVAEIVDTYTLKGVACDSIIFCHQDFNFTSQELEKMMSFSRVHSLECSETTSYCVHSEYLLLTIQLTAGSIILAIN